MKRPNVSLVEEPFTIYYNKYIPLGVYVQHVDGTLYTAADWTIIGFSNDAANGVAVVAKETSFVISKDNVSTSMAWASSQSTLIDGVFTIENMSEARNDFAGKHNTELMLTVDTSGAGYSCANYIFPNGSKGYLPALGEWYIAYQNKSAIDAAMTLIGGTALGSQIYWSSTQSTYNRGWGQSWKDCYTGDCVKHLTNYVRAFSALTL